MSSFTYDGPRPAAIARTRWRAWRWRTRRYPSPAIVAPRAFYDDFPFGASSVSMLPPFNEHLISDVGGFYVAFTLLFAWAAITPGGRSWPRSAWRGPRPPSSTSSTA